MRFFNQTDKPLSFEICLVRYKAAPWGEVVPEIPDRDAGAVAHGLPLKVERHPDAPPLEEVDDAELPKDKPDEGDIIKLLVIAKGEGASPLELNTFEAKLRRLDAREVKEHLAWVL